MICPNCGTNAPDGLPFCGECGTALVPEQQPPAPPADEKRCLKCGAVLEPDSVFCDECGARVTVESSQAPSQPARQFQQPQPIQPLHQPPAQNMPQQMSPNAYNTSQIPQQAFPQPAQNTGYAPQQTMPPQGPAYPVQQNMGTYPGQPPMAQPPQKKSKAPLIIGIVAGIVIVVLLVVFIVVPKLMPQGGNDNSNANSNDNSNVVALNVNNETTPPANNEPKPPANNEPQPPVNNKPTQNANANANTSANPSDSVPSASQMSTKGEPSMGDFTWASSDGTTGKIPDGAIQLDKFDQLTGNWKGYMFGSGLDRFLNVDISGSSASTTATFKWISVASHKDDTPDSTFVGTFFNGVLEATGAGKVTIKSFWFKNGRECAVGEFIWPSGEKDTVLLSRP